MKLLPVLILAIACGGAPSTSTQEALSILPPGWVPWSAGIAEPANEPSTPACGHECPGSPWTHLDGECPTTTTSSPDGSVHLDVDWLHCSTTPTRKICYCADPRSPADFIEASSHGSIDFVISGDELKCREMQALWRTACR